MINFYKVKRYFWSLFGITGVVIFWVGIWDGIGTLPYLGDPLVSFVAGLIILIVSGLIFKELDPSSEAEKSVNVALGRLSGHPKKREFQVKYYDQVRNKHLVFKGDKLKSLEKSFMILKSKKKEIFIPVHRVKEITHRGKPHWKT